VRAFAVIGREWSVEAGELTPTLKVKRKVVEQEYRDLLEAFYAGTVASHGRP
jgi:long-chain acyl-CoA synthetase